MKINYPIKYTLMPIYEDNKLVTYIVSKCYLLSECKKYLVDGSSNYEYGIFFPYEREYINSTNWIRVNPNENNKLITNLIYDNKEAALKDLNTVHRQMLNEYIKQNPNNKDQITRKFDEINNKYTNLSNMIEDNTKDMIINRKKKANEVIIMFGNKDKVFDISLYDFLEKYSAYSFIVCNVTSDEFEIMKKQIKDEGHLKERFSKDDIGYKKDRYFLSNDLKSKETKIYNYNNAKDRKGSFYLDKKFEMHYDGDSNTEDVRKIFLNPLIKAYTLETYNDVLESYVSFDEKDSGYVLKKTISLR